MGRTSTQNNLYLFMGTKGDGKSTNATYLMELLNRPSVVFDVANQYDTSKAYRVVVKGFRGLHYYLTNPKTLKAFKKANMQIIVRFTSSMDKKEEIQECSRLLANYKDFTILFEEMDLYFVFQSSSSNPIYELAYLSRNFNHEVICIFKQASMVHSVLKMNADYIFTSYIEDKNSLKYFEQRSKELAEQIKKLDEYQFIILGKRGFRRVHKLNKKIAKLI